MKSLLLFICCMVQIPLWASQITVSNTPLCPAQFTTINAAISAAANGDTLIIQSSPIAYASNSFPFTLNKKLVIVGGGFNAKKEQIAQTNIGGIILFTGSDSSTIIGCKVEGTVASGTGNRHSLLFQNCIFTNTITFGVSNLAINCKYINCIFMGFINSFTASITSSVYFGNCVFANGSIPYTHSGTFKYENCTFIKGTNYCAGVSNAHFKNCIFYGGQFGPPITSCFFENCLSYGLIDNNIPPAIINNISNSSVNSLININPQFVNMPLNTNYNITVHDININTASPAYNAATNGTQLGVYGGINTTFSQLGEALVAPVVRNFNLVNSVIPQGSSLQLNATITSPNKK